jgi:formylglycine-generating enzyme required for sulfatase activity
MKRLLPLLLFPLLGAGLAWLFRPRALDAYTFMPEQTEEVARTTVILPEGHAIRFLGVPDPAGGTAFFLSESEISEKLWAAYSPNPVTHAQAKSFADHLSALTGKTFRLPTAAEWRFAARGGLPNATVPWGYGLENRPANLVFAQEAPPSRPGPALGFGFRDLAGGRWEWTEEGTLMGGAWSEQNPEVLRIDHAWIPPHGYGDADTGVRLLLEP